MIQALFEELGISEFVYNYKQDQGGHSTHLFYAHPISINLTKSYSSVFVMDCTYKTKKYKMPLLDIIGVSSFNTSFYSCFVFLKKETKDDYVRALNMFSKILGVGHYSSVIVSDRELTLMSAIRDAFPGASNLLCLWHIEKNICKEYKKSFDVQVGWESFMSSWNMIVDSVTESQYEENLKELESSHVERNNVVEYINRVWLPVKQHFVYAWTEKFAHFGNRVSSRAEGAHEKLKSVLTEKDANQFDFG